MTPASRRLAAGLAAALAAGTASSALAQNSASASGSASLTVGNVLTINPSASLSFGRIAVTDRSSAASVTVGTSNAVTGISNAHEVTGGSVASGAFNVSGVGGSTYAVTFPLSSINLGAGANPPTVDTFSTSLPSSIGQLSTDSSGIGQQSFSVGAVLHVPANTPGGSYTGQFPVNVSYN